MLKRLFSRMQIKAIMFYIFALVTLCAGMEAKSEAVWAVLGDSGSVSARHQKKNFSNMSDTLYRVGAFPAQMMGWKFIERYTESNWALEKGNNDETKAVAMMETNPSINPEAFSGIVNGRMTRPGDKPGVPPTWSLAGFLRYYFIKPEKPKPLKYGDSIIFTSVYTYNPHDNGTVEELISKKDGNPSKGDAGNTVEKNNINEWYVGETKKHEGINCTIGKGEGTVELSPGTYTITGKLKETDITDSETLTIYDLQMTRPESSEYKYNYKFDTTEETGICQVPFIFTLIPDTEEIRDYFEDKITLDLDPILNSTFTWTNNATAKYVSNSEWKDVAKFEGLPDKNTEFGEKTFKYTALGETVTGKTKIAFTQDARNHPGNAGKTQKTTNWFYYWRQGVVQGLEEFEFSWATSFFGQYDPTTGKLYITGNATSHSSTYTVKHKTLNLTYTIGGSADNIESVAGTVVHENKHKELQPSNPQADTDSDNLPDIYEEKEPYYFKIGEKDTYNLASIDIGYARYGDQEFLCRMAQKDLKEGNYPNINYNLDWSDTSKQWKASEKK